MASLFGRKDHANPPEEPAPAPSRDVAADPLSTAANVRATGVVSQTPRSNDEPDLAADLIQLIGQAIQEWSRRHNLTNLPPDIVFEQALLALNEVHRLAKQGRQHHQPGDQ